MLCILTQIESLFSQINSDVLGLTLTCGCKTGGKDVLCRLLACSADGSAHVLTHDRGECLSVLLPMFSLSVSPVVCIF